MMVSPTEKYASITSSEHFCAYLLPLICSFYTHFRCVLSFFLSLNISISCNYASSAILLWSTIFLFIFLYLRFIICVYSFVSFHFFWLIRSLQFARSVTIQFILDEFYIGSSTFCCFHKIMTEVGTLKPMSKFKVFLSLCDVHFTVALNFNFNLNVVILN